MWFFLAVCSALLFGAAGLLMKISQMKQGSMHYLLFGLYVSGSLGFLVNSVMEHSIAWDDLKQWAAGILIGMGSAWGNLIFMRALDYGPASLTSPLTNMNIVLVILMSTWYYQEPLNGYEWCGIVLLLVGIVLISVRKEPLTIKEKQWFLLIVLAIFLFAIRNGGLKVTSALGLANTPILLYGYVLSAIWFGITARRSETQPEHGDKRTSRTGLIWGLLAGLFSYGGLQLYSVALQIGKANVVAPIFATNSLVIVFGSILLYKEKLTVPQQYAIAFLFAGLILIRL